MFAKVLIANRGAIAVRLLRTLKRLGIASVVVYHQADARSLHVQQADEAWSLGDGSLADTYLNIDRLLEIAQVTGAQAIHPGYGFLSENPAFVRRCEAAGVVFIGPTPEQMEVFGLKHRARQLVEAAGVPLLPGSDLLQELGAACAAAARIGYPVMLKATAGGGGIGMQLCPDEAALRGAFERVKRLSSNNFSDDGVFLEKFVARARHIEVQVLGDGRGQTLALGERDCSSQRRNQKVVEECPAPGLSDALRSKLHATAEQLLASVAYRNAGTVEFLVDAAGGAFYFLEVNTRLQVEHGVTEAVYGVDLVEGMLRLAAGELLDLAACRQQLKPVGHALQVRIYAEDPWRNFQPSPGLLSEVHFPELPGVRLDHWITSGIEVPALFDPLLAKVIVKGEDRAQALQQLQSTLQQIRLYGTQTNLDYLLALCRDPVLQAGNITTTYLDHFRYQPLRIDLLQPGTLTTLQDWPGRKGYWDVGVPPSGPFDARSFRLGNRLLGNAEGAVGLEITLQGPLLEFSSTTQVLLAGAPADARLNGEAVLFWQVLNIQPGDRLQVGRIQSGARAYLCVRGGILCPDYLGSASTFTLGQFGGHNGRALRSGDVLHLVAGAEPVVGRTPDAALLPAISSAWRLRVIYGPQGAPDYFTATDIQTFFATDWEVHYNSSRTGIRLIGPKLQWARLDGGEAGLHPSNIHDNAYAFGSVDFTGDMPVILGPDGPSLGGFVCPATVIAADLWKLGQLRAGDRIRFVPVSLDTAVALEAAQQQSIRELRPVPLDWRPTTSLSPVLDRLPAAEFGDDILIRAAGDHFLLVEYGAQELDLRLRFRAHALMQWLQQHPLPGLEELTPGVRSLQLHFDSQQLSHARLLQHLRRAERQLAGQLDALTVPSRTLWLPLSWDDEACRLAIEKYMQSVRKEAPWCPSNLEFIRRINGLERLEEVKRILFEATYLVIGLGDVYLGAPLATPLDPRHRLVTTKYNPARTWTAENSVGIGGSYLCIYGMEGPGGYQFVGRTLQMWNRQRQTREFEQPWLLRFFDQIRFYEVSAEALQQIRHDFPLGAYPLRIEEGSFSLTEYQAFLAAEKPSIDAFTRRREAAFAAELEHWHATGQFNFSDEAEISLPQAEDWPEGSLLVDSPVSGSVWQWVVKEGDPVEAGQTLLMLESMKMEMPLLAPAAGVVIQLRARPGSKVTAGQVLVVMQSE